MTTPCREQRNTKARTQIEHEHSLISHLSHVFHMFKHVCVCVCILYDEQTEPKKNVCSLHVQNI